MEIPIENKKGLLQNDRLLVCGMLLFYGFCIMGLIGSAFWWLNQRSQGLATNATATAVVIATQQAEITATAVAHATELAQYEMIDRFDTNDNDWLTGFEDSEYWTGYRRIKDGVIPGRWMKLRKLLFRGQTILLLKISKTLMSMSIRRHLTYPLERYAVGLFSENLSGLTVPAIIIILAFAIIPVQSSIFMGGKKDGKD
jgi:hypothetical protein